MRHHTLKAQSFWPNGDGVPRTAPLRGSWPVPPKEYCNEHVHMQSQCESGEHITGREKLAARKSHWTHWNSPSLEEARPVTIMPPVHWWLFKLLAFHFGRQFRWSTGCLMRLIKLLPCMHQIFQNSQWSEKKDRIGRDRWWNGLVGDGERDLVEEMCTELQNRSFCNANGLKRDIEKKGISKWWNGLLGGR